MITSPPPPSDWPHAPPTLPHAPSRSLDSLTPPHAPSRSLPLPPFADLLVLHLRPEKSDSTEERARGVEAWAQYIAGSLPLVDDASDPDGRSEISRPLVDGRHTMLEMSMFRHIQFDSLRRAKHATSLLLYHLHFPERSLDAYCSTCAARLVGLRWHCATCTNFDVCSDCALTPGKKSVHNHPLTPYHVSDIYYEQDDA